MSNPKECEHGKKCCEACQHLRFNEPESRPRVRGCSHDKNCCEDCRRARVKTGMYRAQESGKKLGRPAKSTRQSVIVRGWGYA